MAMFYLHLRSRLSSPTNPIIILKIMRKEIIEVPDGIRYLSQWIDLWNILPQNQHYILNKRICGCGATELFINSRKKVILASPRKQLLYNKYSQHIGDNFHLYRYLGDKTKYFEGKESQADILTFQDNLKSYLGMGGNVIMSTYDSMKDIQNIMMDIGCSLSDWIIVVDEFQVIFHDCQFKAETEHELYLTLQQFPYVVYLSATPYLEKYLDITKQFGNLTIYELLWPENMTVLPNVEVIKTNKSILSLCEKIIEDYRNGNGRSIINDGQMFVSKEAVFYINSVQEIKKVVKKNHLMPDEVSIICSSTQDNIKKLKSLSDDMGAKYEIAEVVGKGQPHKMFTFCTSTVYVGADFYSESAYSYIFANPNINSMAIDVCVDIQQIIGRQRLESNPFKNSGTLYFKTKAPRRTIEELENEIAIKNQKTMSQIENYNAVPNKHEQLRLIEDSIKSKGHVDHYCSISMDSTNQVELVKNEIIEIAERRAWEVTDSIYRNDFTMYKALKGTANITMQSDSSDCDIQKLFAEWNKDNQFSRKAQMYCSLYQDLPEYLEKCNFIENKYHKYHRALGQEGMEALYWREDLIRKALEPKPFDVLPKDKIAAELIKNLRVGKDYTKTEVKELLSKIYLDLGVKNTAVASDVREYLTVKDMSKRIKGKKTAILSVTSYDRINISLFHKITEIKSPTIYDGDGVLDIIRTGKYFNLQYLVEKIRKTTDKNEIDRLKRLLPAVTWNGTFKTKNCNDLSCYSSFTALDFDKIPPERMNEVAEWFEQFPCVYAYFVTPSGNGYKAIIIHDNYEPLYHYDLYHQLLKTFDCPWIDNSTCDLARGNFLSYDPNLRKNPNPKPFHFIPSMPITDYVQYVPTETIVRNDKGEDTIEFDSDPVSKFLNTLQNSVISDDEIIRILRKTWTGEAITRGRNNAAMSYAGVLCKAGVKKETALSFIQELIPNFDLTEIIEYAYNHNVFSCQRRKYRGKR